MLKVILQFPAPSVDFVVENIVSCGVAVTLHMLMASLLFITPFSTFDSALYHGLPVHFHPFSTCWLPVSGAGGVMLSDS